MNKEIQDIIFRHYSQRGVSGLLDMPVFWVDANSVRTYGEAERAIIEVFRHYPEETSLDLSWCGIDNDALRLVVMAMQDEACHVTQLDLSHNNIDHTGARCLSPLVCQKLIHLDISYNQIDDVGIMQLGLDAKDQALSVEQFTTALLGQTFNALCPLTSLNLSFTQCTEKGMRYLSVLLEYRFTQLSRLNVSMNGLLPEGVTALMLGLNQSKRRIEHLDVSHCSMLIDGANAMQEWLSQPHCFIRSLAVAGNGLNDEGATKITDGLIKNPNQRLEALDLSSNHIIKGALNLAVMIKFNHDRGHENRLERLELRDNFIVPEDIAYLTKSIQAFRSRMVSIDICDQSMWSLIMLGANTQVFENMRQKWRASGLSDALTHNRKTRGLALYWAAIILHSKLSWNLVSIILLMTQLPSHLEPGEQFIFSQISQTGLDRVLKNAKRDWQQSYLVAEVLSDVSRGQDQQNSVDTNANPPYHLVRLYKPSFARRLFDKLFPTQLPLRVGELSATYFFQQLQYLQQSTALLEPGEGREGVKGGCQVSN